MHSNYIQMPPDSTGKKVTVNPVWELHVSDATQFAKSNIVTGETSGVSMIVVGVNTFTDHLYAKYIGENQEGGSFTVGENLQVNGVTKSTLSSTQTPLYVNTTSLVSHDNPFHGQRVDAQGQAYIRYEEGSQILDACGRAKGSVETTIGSYGFPTDTQWDEFVHHEFTGVGSSTAYDALDGRIKLITGITNDGATLVRTHKYHMHPKGTGLFSSFLCSLGDSGKANVIREWGYFDDANGIKFKLNGTALSVCVHGTLTGGTVTSEIAQADWNRDKLDGTGNSGMTLDISKVNRYWVDIYRGVRFRIGVYGANGSRITAHEFYASNSSTLTLGSTSLPLSFHQYNIGIPASASEFNFYEGVVQIESDGNPQKQTPYFESAGNVQANCSSSVWTPLVSIRPVDNSQHAIALLVATSISSVLAGTENPGRVKVEVFKNATLTGATFATTKTGSFFVVDKAATAMTGGRAISEHMIAGTDNIDMEKFCSYIEENLLQNIDGTKNTYTLAVKPIAGNCDCVGAVNWEEYQV